MGVDLMTKRTPGRREAVAPARPAVSRRRRVIAGVLFLALGVTAVFALWPRGESSIQFASGHSAHEPSATSTAEALAVPTGAPTSSVTGDPGATPTSVPVSSAAPSDEVSLEEVASEVTPGKRNNASLPGARGPIDPAALLSGDSFGGCLIEYGDNGQCLTVYPPSEAGHVQDMLDAGEDPALMEHDWTCGELVRYFPEGITVRQPGIDPQGLDDDLDGTACEPD